MANNLLTRFKTLPPQKKRILFVIGALGAVFLAVTLFSPAPRERHADYNKRRDQSVNVFTDRSSRADNLDALSGSVSRLRQETNKLKSDIEASLKKLEDRAAQDRRENKDRILHIESMIQELRNAPPPTPVTPDSVFKSVPEQSAVGADKGDGKGDAKRSSGQRGKSGGKESSLKMSIISEQRPQKKEEVVDEAPVTESVAYIPAGSIITGTILTGGDFPTSKGGMENPTPLLVRISKEAILPNRRTSDIRECFLLMGGRGDLSSERVKLRGETLSCIRDDGSVIESKLNSFLTGEDGKEGIRGRLVSKQGQLIARSLVAGFASGLSEAFDVNAVPTISTSSDGTVQYERVYSSEAMQGAAVKGFSNAMEDISEFYLDMAREIFPVLEINAGRQVDVIVINGTQLKIKAEGGAVDTTPTQGAKK